MSGGGGQGGGEPRLPGVEEVQRRLGVRFPSPELLTEAFTHPSYAHEQPEPRPPHNERLEFLGDAVVGLAVAHELWERFPDRSEGELAGLRAALVNQRALAARCRALGLERYLRLGRGEERSGGRSRDAALCDLFEAVVGAIFAALGWEAARRFVTAQLEDALTGAARGGVRDPKSELQERLQQEGDTPSYRLVGAWGPAHARRFAAEVVWQGRVLGRGEGTSKKEAEEAAARAALARASFTAPGGAPPPSR